MKVPQKSPSDFQQRGATIGDLLAYLALTAIFTAILIPAFSSMFQEAERTKLESDAHVLNQAASTYLASGGDLSGDLSVDEVITRFRTIPTNSTVWLIGAEESLAVNLKPVMQSTAEANSDQARVIWNPQKKSFQVAESGAPGAKAFKAIRQFDPEDFAIPEVAGPKTEENSTAARASWEQEQIYAPYRPR